MDIADFNSEQLRLISNIEMQYDQYIAARRELESILGTPLEHVVCSLSPQSIASRIVAPDPRWMALHKLWLSRQAKRKAEKRPKDAKQGALLLKAVQERMARFPLDEQFEASIPEALQPIYREWKQVGVDFHFRRAASI